MEDKNKTRQQLVNELAELRQRLEELENVEPRVRRIVEKLDGQVGVESEVSAGSVFWFTLPAQQHL